MSKFIVTTPTGNIGSRIAQRLVGDGADVTLIARDPAKVESLVAAGAKVEKGSLDDAAFLTRATAGAEAMFWLTPANFGTDDLIAHQRKCGEAAATAIKANGIGRVVNLSSIGAQNPKGGGPINGLHDVEKILDGTKASITHLRPAYFFENYLPHLETIKAMGSAFMPVSGGLRQSMVGTKDIAQVAADRLLDDSWTGRSTRGIHGPADLTMDEAAAAISEGVGRTVHHMTVTPGQAREAMLSMGLPADSVDLMLELYAGMESGTVSAEEPRTPETTTPTTLTEFAREVMAKAL